MVPMTQKRALTTQATTLLVTYEDEGERTRKDQFLFKQISIVWLA